MVEVDEPLGRTSWRACGAAHASALARTLGWAAERSRLLALGILGTLALFLGGAVSAALGRPAWLEPEDPVALFRLGIALTVLPLGWLAPESQTSGARGLAPESQPAAACRSRSTSRRSWGPSGSCGSSAWWASGGWWRRFSTSPGASPDGQA